MDNQGAVIHFVINTLYCNGLLSPLHPLGLFGLLGLLRLIGTMVLKSLRTWQHSHSTMVSIAPSLNTFHFVYLYLRLHLTPMLRILNFEILLYFSLLWPPLRFSFKVATRSHLLCTILLKSTSFMFRRFRNIRQIRKLVFHFIINSAVGVGWWWWWC